MAGSFKRGGFRGGGFKKSWGKKREADDDESAPASKKARGDEGDNTTPLIPELHIDDEGNKFINLKANGTRRVTVSDFKGNTLVSIREYYNADGQMRPGKKGISLTMDQYNALLAAAPLLESVLTQREEQVVRPDYDSEPANAAAPKEEGTEEEGSPVKKVEDEESEDE